MAKDDKQICGRCGGSGIEEVFKVPPPKGMKKLLVEHSFDRHELFRSMDRIISNQVIGLAELLKKNDGTTMAELYEECHHYFEKAGKAWANGENELALKALFHASCNITFILESFHYAGYDEEPEDGENEQVD